LSLAAVHRRSLGIPAKIALAVFKKPQTATKKYLMKELEATGFKYNWRQQPKTELNKENGLWQYALQRASSL